MVPPYQHLPSYAMHKLLSLNIHYLDLCRNRDAMANIFFNLFHVGLLSMVSTSALAQVPIGVLELLGLMSSLMPKLDLSYPLISLMPIHGSPLVLKENYTLHFSFQISE